VLEIKYYFMIHLCIINDRSVIKVGEGDREGRGAGVGQTCAARGLILTMEVRS